MSNMLISPAPSLNISSKNNRRSRIVLSPKNENLLLSPSLNNDTSKMDISPIVKNRQRTAPPVDRLPKPLRRY